MVPSDNPPPSWYKPPSLTGIWAEWTGGPFVFNDKDYPPGGPVYDELPRELLTFDPTGGNEVQLVGVAPVDLAG